MLTNRGYGVRHPHACNEEHSSQVPSFRLVKSGHMKIMGGRGCRGGGRSFKLFF
jgi:hypothetical protein